MGTPLSMRLGLAMMSDVPPGTAAAERLPLLRERYAQYRVMQLSELPVIALRIERVTSWGNLTVCPPE